MTDHYELRTLTIFIARPFEDVYEYLATAENFSQWAAGLGNGVRFVDGAWIADTPRGAITIRFSKRNEFGIVDHYVVPQPGVEIYVPMRVIANGFGSEVLFTLFRLPEMTDEQFEADGVLVQQDLATMKQILES
ncbi:MAG: SRPBCC family protein [Abditibacteriaceae bacterium]